MDGLSKNEHDPAMGAYCAPLMLKEHKLPGVLISVCGIDGSGKTTTIKLIADYLAASGVKCVSTFTPTLRMRKDDLFRAMVDPRYREKKNNVDVLAMALMILGDLIQHWNDTIQPHLERGDVVICDRYIYTSQAEIIARSSTSMPAEAINYLSRFIFKPDLAICTYVNANLARQRILDRNNAADQPDEEDFMIRQGHAYKAVARANKMFIVSSEQSQQDSFDQLKVQLLRCLRRIGAKNAAPCDQNTALLGEHLDRSMSIEN
jgi:dTMP kinase